MCHIDSSVARIAEQGFCVLNDVIPSDDVSRVRNSISETVKAHRVATAPQQIGFVPGLINYDQSFAEYLVAPRLGSIIGNFLGDHHRISFTSAIVNEPGNDRGSWHADWPFNQKNAGRIVVPYMDCVVHLTTLWMLTDFDRENGGTLVRPRSHRLSTNPTIHDATYTRSPGAEHFSVPQPLDALEDEVQVTGAAGSVLIMDSRSWHATAPNRSAADRVALAVRFAPWWLDLEVLRPGSKTRKRLCGETGLSENVVPSLPQVEFDKLPSAVKPLYEHWLDL